MCHFLNIFSIFLFLSLIFKNHLKNDISYYKKKLSKFSSQNSIIILFMHFFIYPLSLWFFHCLSNSLYVGILYSSIPWSRITNTVKTFSLYSILYLFIFGSSLKTTHFQSYLTAIVVLRLILQTLSTFLQFLMSALVSIIQCIN